MSTSKFATKKSIPKAVKIEDVQFMHNNKPVSKEEFLRAPRTHAQAVIDKLTAAADEFLAEYNAPSFGRLVASLVCGLAVYAGGLYLGLPLATAVVVAVTSLTGAGFLAFFATILSYFTVGFAACWLGIATYHWVLEARFEHLADAGAAVRDAAKRRVSLVRDWFTRNDPVAV
jgi:uncharacterized membrane protein YdfJ with MMPL/SSD domain